MTSLAALWIPILLSAVLVFIASAIVHMLMPWHKGNYPKLQREQEFRDAVRPFAIPPGDYMVPRAVTPEEMKSEAYRARLREGPNMLLTVMPNAEMGMGKQLAQWFVFLLVVAVFGAYIASRTLPPGADYLRVFQLVGATTFAAFGLGLWELSIWYRRSWSLTLKGTFDALLYGLLMAGVFGWLWPA